MINLDPLLNLARGTLHCRGCLGPLRAGAEAGLCANCWEGLTPLPQPRCERCALPHGSSTECPSPIGWSLGDAFWDYHGGRPPLGALLLPGIKAGEQAWMRALLRHVARAPLPEQLTGGLNLVTAAPTPRLRRFLRGFDLAEVSARLIAQRLALPYLSTLTKTWQSGHQAERSEGERKRLSRRAIRVRPHAGLEGLCILLMDDVWTTGTTLLRSAQALEQAGAAEVRVLTLFRAMRF